MQIMGLVMAYLHYETSKILQVVRFLLNLKILI
jgi:hypothetical protein